MRLSVLDQSPIPSGSTPTDALRTTVELARLADRLGYTRYWLAEHHNMRALAGSAPEVLIGHVAAATRGIRVGSGGVMLSHYSPLKVAESFRLLHALHPGRIDLGIGRAPGSDQRTAAALQPAPTSVSIEQFPDQVADLLGYLHDRLPPGHPFAGIRAMPESPGAPEVWVLGSGGSSAVYASYFGLPFAYAHFINPQGGEQQAALFRERYQPSPEHPGPRVAIAAAAICAETDEEAERLAQSVRLWRLRLERGDPGPIPSVEEAEAYPYTDHERARIAGLSRRYAVGSPQTVRARLTALAEAFGAEELVVVTICHDQEARRRSYELLAAAFELEPRELADTPAGTAAS